jgi:hypothetical protein
MIDPVYYPYLGMLIIAFIYLAIVIFFVCQKSSR